MSASTKRPKPNRNGAFATRCGVVGLILGLLLTLLGLRAWGDLPTSIAYFLVMVVASSLVTGFAIRGLLKGGFWRNFAATATALWLGGALVLTTVIGPEACSDSLPSAVARLLVGFAFLVVFVLPIGGPVLLVYCPELLLVALATYAAVAWLAAFERGKFDREADFPFDLLEAQIRRAESVAPR